MNTLSGKNALACLCLLSPISSWAQEKISVNDNERPPYLADLSMKNFRQVKFPDLPTGDKRQIMGSKQVPDKVIGRLNKAIAVG